MQDDEDDQDKRKRTAHSSDAAARDPTANPDLRDAQIERVADKMSDEEWLEAILELNPWASAFKESDFEGEEFEEARKKASWQRLNNGRNAWNGWANKMLNLRAVASVTLTVDFDIIALADFDGEEIIDDRLKFSYLIFPGTASFRNTKFKEKAYFLSTQFFDGAIFFDARFKKSAYFRKSKFAGILRFDDTIFSGDVGFGGVTFAENAHFENTKFCRSVSFQQLRKTDLEGSRVTFHKMAIFDSCIFGGPANFSFARFCADASFTSITSDRGIILNGVSFSQTPDFTDAAFHEPPRLDDCDVADPLNEFQPFRSTADDPRPRDARFLPVLFPIWRIARDADEHARFRKLRKMAADAKDHENELKFNGYEIAARRFWVDKPNEARFWLGWLYGLFSDYGQSVKRPFLTWLALIWTFWAIFLVFTPDHTQTAHGTQCHEQYRSAVGEDVAALRFTSPGWQALSLSLRNASVIAQPDTAVTRRIYGCLYGFERAALSSDGDATEAIRWPVIPPSVTYLSALQSVLSAIFLFLTGLCLRNTFRMK